MLPDTCTERPATGSDLTAVTELVIATDIAEFGEPDWSEQDQVDEWALPGFSLETDSLLVHDATGRLVGYAYLHQRVAGADFDGDTFVHPDADNEGIEEHLIEFVERRARDLVDPTVARPTLVMVTHAANEARAARFRAAGFRPVRHFFRMTVDLSTVTSADVPRDVVIRPAVLPDELPRMHAVLTESFTGHFRSVALSFEDWQARHPVRPEDRAPWLVAERAGEVVGALIGSATMPGVGWVSVLGVLPSARGSGIAGALLHRAFADFAALGLARASLGVDADNTTGAVGVYERVGMRVERRFDFYEKALAG